MKEEKMMGLNFFFFLSLFFGDSPFVDRNGFSNERGQPTFTFAFRHGLPVVASARDHVGWQFGAQLVRRRGFAGTAEVKTEVAAQPNVLFQRADRQPRERLVLDSFKTFSTGWNLLSIYYIKKKRKRKNILNVFLFKIIIFKIRTRICINVRRIFDR